MGIPVDDTYAELAKNASTQNQVCRVRRLTHRN